MKPITVTINQWYPDGSHAGLTTLTKVTSGTAVLASVPDPHLPTEIVWKDAETNKEIKRFRNYKFTLQTVDEWYKL